MQFCAYFNTFKQLLPIGVSVLNEVLGTSIKCGDLAVVGVDSLAGLTQICNTNVFSTSLHSNLTNGFRDKAIDDMT